MPDVKVPDIKMPDVRVPDLKIPKPGGGSLYFSSFKNCYVLERNVKEHSPDARKQKISSYQLEDPSSSGVIPT